MSDKIDNEIFTFVFSIEYGLNGIIIENRHRIQLLDHTAERLVDQKNSEGNVLPGISCAGKTAVQLRKSDYGKFDLFICMDTANIHNMNRILGGDPEGKIYKLMTFAGSGRDVSDPWYSRDFETAYKDIEEGCRGLLRHLREELQ